MLHQAKFIIIQTVLLAGIAVLWFYGLLSRPFTGVSRVVCGVIVAFCILALIFVFFRRWADAKWVASNVVRIGLAGTVIGLIMAFNAASHANAGADAQALMSSVLSGMMVAMYATLLGVFTSWWTSFNIWLLARP
jgi:hypothetical protein